MSDLKIGDRVRVISGAKIIKTTKNKSINGMTGTVKALDGNFAGVEFDNYMGGHNGLWGGKDGYCWYILYEHLEKIEDTEEETKEEVNEEIEADTKVDILEQKILTVLRKEIGVLIGDEFDVYENGEKKWICRFEVRGFSHLINGEFYKSGVWKQIVCKFHSYQFKKKPFAPKYGEDYFFLAPEYDKSKGLNFRALQSTWIDSSIDCGMLAVGNIFRTKEEALKRRDELLEKPNELSKGE